jgi:anthranilate phosphoribosyltransferase
LFGFHSALEARSFRLSPPAAPAKPVVLASFTGTRRQPNLVPLLALALQRFGVPVLIHGALHVSHGVGSAHVLRELGIMPCAHLTDAQAALDERKVAFVPTALLAPGLAELFHASARLGFGNAVSTVSKLLDPFEGDSLKLIATADDVEHALLQEFLAATGANAMLLSATEGEPFADPRCRPAMVHYSNGESRVLFDAESKALLDFPTAPSVDNAVETAQWIRRILKGEVPVPLPIVNQLACCLFGAGYTHDVNQAKAITAIETGSLAAA